MPDINSFPISTKRVTDLDSNTSLLDTDLFLTVNNGIDKNITGAVVKGEIEGIFHDLNLFTTSELNQLQTNTSDILGKEDKKLVNPTSLIDTDATITAASLLGRELTIQATAVRTLTTDTADNILNEMGVSVNGDSFNFTIVNTGEGVVVVASGLSVSLVGNMEVYSSATFRVTRLSPSIVSVTRLSSCQDLASSLEARDGLNDTKIITPFTAEQAFGQYGLGRDLPLEGALDLDSIASTSIKYGSGLVNAPSGVSVGIVSTMYTTAGGGRSLQTIFPVNTGDMYIRSNNSGTWGSWSEVAHTGNMSYDTTENGSSVRTDGFSEKWGRVSIVGSGDVSGSVTFPTAFLNNCINVTLTLITSSGVGESSIFVDPSDLPDSVGFGWSSDGVRLGSEFYYRAIGY